MKTVKRIVTVLLMIVILGTSIAAFGFGAKVLNYRQRGFELDKAIAWTCDDFVGKYQHETDVEREIRYTVNRFVDVLPCVDLRKKP